MTKTFSTILLLLAFACVQAQSEGIKFDDVKHDFGTVYKGAPVEHTFSFTNVSGKDVSLVSVKASCGCTTPDWSKDVVKNKSKGSVSAKYDSFRVGQFTKTITVTYDSSRNVQPIVLTITGTILDTTHQDEHAGHNHAPEPSIYNFPQGNLSFDKIAEEIGTIDTDKKKELTFRVRNMGTEKIRFIDEPQSEKIFTQVKCNPQSLGAGEIGLVIVTLDAAKYDEKGPFTKKVSLKTDDAAGAVKEFTISGEFNKVMTAEEKALAPNIQFDMIDYDAGKVIDGEKVVHAFKFTNTGKTDLVIESAKGSCGCTVAEPKDKIIKPGESSSITATFDSSGRSGLNNKTVTVKSNDPDNENVVLKLTINVEKDPFHAGDAGPVERK